MNEEFDQTWRAVSEEALAGVKEWQVSYPKATFQELEQAIHERLSRLEAQVLQEAALARTASDCSYAPERDHPRCPTCPRDAQRVEAAGPEKPFAIACGRHATFGLKTA